MEVDTLESAVCAALSAVTLPEVDEGTTRPDSDARARRITAN
jgi:hypothetical protein